MQREYGNGTEPIKSIAWGHALYSHEIVLKFMKMIFYQIFDNDFVANPCSSLDNFVL